MAVFEIGPRLRDRLGADPATDLVQTLNAAHAETLTVVTERFEARLTVVAERFEARLSAVSAELKTELRKDIVNGDAAIRVALADGLAAIRQEMSRLRVDVLRWSLLFWLGQFAAISAMFTLLLRAIGR